MICQIPGCVEHFACKLRAKNFALGPAIQTNRISNQRRTGPRTPDPAWERGVKGEVRPDGSFMPYLSPTTGAKLRVKEYGENRRQIDERVKRLKTDPNVFQKGNT